MKMENAKSNPLRPFTIYHLATPFMKSIRVTLAGPFAPRRAGARACVQQESQRP